MIKFALVCQNDHRFEAWFKSGAAYEAQAASAQVFCPHCGSADVSKAIMAPAVAGRGRARAEAPKSSGDPSIPQLQQVLRQLRDAVRANAEYVGERFAEEARRIHFDESPARGIYGEATADEVKSLAEDGIPFVPVPRLPEDIN